MHTLKSYRQANGIRQADLASSIGVEQATISKLESGSFRPGLELAIKIEDATGGAVPARSWLAPEFTPSAEAAE
ncbi:Helix-turn-helix [Ruegeria lacuscaerulensis ITI-1157]|nr:Helix-turn-helix [Ruegeria lacuscaerulensis ITI-1157]